METLLIALAGFGLLLMIIGRYMMVRDTGGDLPFLWIIALRLIPFSELVYMVRHYAQAKAGGITCIVGMWLMVPWIGTQIWETEQHLKQQFAEIEQDAGEAEDEDEDGLDPEMLKEMPAEMRVFYFKSRKERLAEKTRKVEQMNARLKWWFDQLQSKRESLAAAEADAVKRFNAEVNAYTTYNALAKEANEELVAMQTPRARR